MDVLDIHVIYSNEKYVIFHPASFSLFIVTNEIGRILKFYELESKNLILIANKFGTSKQYIAEILNYISEKIKRNSSKDPTWTGMEPRALNLLISQDCNLECSYCYADHGTYGGKKRFMDLDTAKKCIDKLLSKDYENYLVFFGGEPFLNFSLIKEIDSYLSNAEMSAKYTAVTNGTIMNDEIKNFINKKFFDLSISLDGTKEINDMQRYGSVESVHDCVVKTISKLTPRNYTISIRSVGTKKSIFKLEDVIEYICSLNVDSMSIEPANDISPESEFYISDDDYATYISKLINISHKNICEMAKGNKIVLNSYLIDLLRLIITRTRKIYMCAAGREFLTITANGDVYPCHMYLGMDEYKMGNVHDSDFPGREFNKIRDMLYKNSIYNLSECNACWARFLCGGDCHWQSCISFKDISRPTKRRCFEMKSIIEALLPKIADLFQDEIYTRNLLNTLTKKDNVMPESLC